LSTRTTTRTFCPTWVLMWFQGEDDGDLVGRPGRCPGTTRRWGGISGLLTPKAGADRGHVEPSDIGEAAPTAGLSQTSSVGAPPGNWVRLAPGGTQGRAASGGYFPGGRPPVPPPGLRGLIAKDRGSYQARGYRLRCSSGSKIPIRHAQERVRLPVAAFRWHTWGVQAWTRGSSPRVI